MSIACATPISVEEFCTPSCTRWSQINAGEPVRIYHDTSNYDPNCRPIVNEPDPQVYLDAAIATWESGYPCGQLFEMVDDPALAQVIVVHDTNNFGEPLGTATCACDAEDDICVRQVDHSIVFSAANPAIVTIYCQPGTNFANIQQYINIWVHELGHILGMGHVYGVPNVDSIMGLSTTPTIPGELKEFDLLQLQMRHPCDCILTQNFRPFYEARPINQSGGYCPVCNPAHRG